MEFEMLITSYSRLSADYCSFRSSRLRPLLVLPAIISVTEWSGGSVQVAIQKDRGIYPKQKRKHDHGLGFSGGPSTIQLKNAPVSYRRKMSGTAIMALHLDGCIYAGADGRVVRVKDGRIFREDDTKLFRIHGKRLLATTSGRVDLADGLLDIAKHGLKMSKSPTEVMADLKTVAENWQKEKVQRKGECYPSNLGLCGFVKGKPYLLLSDSLDPPDEDDEYNVREITSDEGKKATVLLSGSGSRFACAHLTNLGEAVFEPNANICEIILECLAVASMFCYTCGGQFQSAVLKNRGKWKFDKNRPHLFSQIVKSFFRLHILGDCLLHVTRKALYKVWGGEKDEMNKHLLKELKGAQLVNVIGVNRVKKITVRLVLFKDRPAKEKAKDDQKLKLTAGPKDDFLAGSQNSKVIWHLWYPTLKTFETLSKQFETNCGTS